MVNSIQNASDFKTKRCSIEEPHENKCCLTSSSSYWLFFLFFVVFFPNSCVNFSLNCTDEPRELVSQLPHLAARKEDDRNPQTYKMSSDNHAPMMTWRGSYMSNIYETKETGPRAYREPAVSFHCTDSTGKISGPWEPPWRWMTVVAHR